MYPIHIVALLELTLASLSLSQAATKCSPLKERCPPDVGLNRESFTSDFTRGRSSLAGWANISGNISCGSDGAEFTIAQKGDSPTIETGFYVFFGKAEVLLRAAAGIGIVSSIVLQSDVLDEVDWEALGGDTSQIQTDYFGKGDNSSYNHGADEAVATPQEVFHTYTIDWSPKAINWSIDGVVHRTLAYAEANSGSRFPQTPMRLRLGIWAGGDSDNAPGTISWAGGRTDYAAGPFTMHVKSVYIENTYPSSRYTYGDNSGFWGSIKTDASRPPA